MIERQIVLVDIIYFLPDYRHLLQEFILQMEDLVPDIPHVHHFLDFWRTNIDAVIHEVNVSCSPRTNFSNIQFFKVLH